MKSESFHWKQFLNLGEDFLRQSNTDEQRRLIESTVEKRLNCRARIWLAEPFYPLPGSPDTQTLPHTAAPEIVLEVFYRREILCRYSSNQKFQPYSSDAQPVLVAFPLLNQDHLLGILLAERPEGPAFSDQDIDFLEGITYHAALALETSRQASLKNWRYEQINLLRSVSAQITKVLDLDRLFHHATRIIQEKFGYYFVAIFTLEDDRKTLKLQACASSDPAIHFPPDYHVNMGAGIVGHAAQREQELIVKDTGHDTRYVLEKSLPETIAEAAIPLLIEGNLLGILDVQSNQKYAFHEIDMLVLRSLADNIALAIEGMHLYSDLQRRVNQVAAILEVSQKLNSILHLETLLSEVVQIIHKRFGYPFVQIFTVHAFRRLVIYETSNIPLQTAASDEIAAYELDDPIGIIPWVARNNQAKMVHDVQHDPVYRPSGFLFSGACSEMAVPLSHTGEVEGVLDIQSDKVNAFDENDLSLLEGLAAGIAVAIHNATLYKREQWRHQVADSFNDIAGLISANTALEPLLDAILYELERNLPSEVSAIWLLEENKPRTENGLRPLKLAALHGMEKEKTIKTWKNNPAAFVWLERALNFNEPGLRKAGDPLGPLGFALNYPEDYSSLAAPLKSSNQPLGVLALAHPSPSIYGSEARSMVGAFANYASVAIQNARLYSEAQEQAWSSTVLLQVAEASQASATVEDLFSTMVRLMPFLVGIKKCAVFLRDEIQGDFELKASYGFDLPSKGRECCIAEDAAAFSRLKRVLTTITIDDPVKELNLPANLLPPEAGTLVLLPMIVRGELLGALLVAHQPEGQPGAEIFFNDRTLSILQGIVHQVAVAYDNLRLMESRQQEGYVTAVLLQVAHAISSQKDLADILSSIVSLLPILVGIDTCIIYLWDKEKKIFHPAQAHATTRQEEEALLQKPVASGVSSLIDQSFEQNTPSFCPLSESLEDLTQWEEINCWPVAPISTSSPTRESDWLLCFPIASKGEKYGVLLAKEAGAPFRYQARRLEILNGVVQQTALAIENEDLKIKMVERQRIEQEFQLARQIQKTFLPDHMPHVAGWDFCTRWLTAREVGGDFYDIFTLDSCHFGLVIADVSDKGMPAALYMTVARTLIRAYAQSGLSPAAVLEKVNNLLAGDTQEGMFVTAVFAVLCVEDGEFTYANAGHNQPILTRSQDNSPLLLPKGGMALGVLENTTYDEHVFYLQPGDHLLMYTDGVTDTFSPDGEPFGEARLLQTLPRLAGDDARTLLDDLDRVLSDYRKDTHLSDDLTILCIYRLHTGRKKPTPTI